MFFRYLNVKEITLSFILCKIDDTLHYELFMHEHFNFAYEMSENNDLIYNMLRSPYAYDVYCFLCVRFEGKP